MRVCFCLLLASWCLAAGLETRRSGKPGQNVRMGQALSLDKTWQQVMCLEEGNCSGKEKSPPGKFDEHKLWNMIKKKEEAAEKNHAGPGDKYLLGDLIHRMTVHHPPGTPAAPQFPYRGGTWVSDQPTANVDYEGGTWVGDRGSPAKDAGTLKALAKKMQYVAPGMAKKLRDVASRLTAAAKRVECDRGSKDERALCKMAQELKDFAEKSKLHQVEGGSVLGVLGGDGAPGVGGAGGKKTGKGDAGAETVQALWKRVRAVEMGADDAEGDAVDAPLTQEEKLQKEDKRIMAELRAQLPKQNISYAGPSLNVTLVPPSTDDGRR